MNFKKKSVIFCFLVLGSIIPIFFFRGGDQSILCEVFICHSSFALPLDSSFQGSHTTVASRDVSGGGGGVGVGGGHASSSNIHKFEITKSLF